MRACAKSELREEVGREGGEGEVEGDEDEEDERGGEPEACI